MLLPSDPAFMTHYDLDENKVFLVSPPETGSYVCEFCGKQYKYFNPYQEHVALHAPMSESLWLPL